MKKVHMRVSPHKNTFYKGMTQKLFLVILQLFASLLKYKILGAKVNQLINRCLCEITRDPHYLSYEKILWLPVMRNFFHNILEKREKYCPSVSTPAAALCVTLRVPTLDLLMGWNEQFWSKTYFLNLQNKENSIFLYFFILKFLVKKKKKKKKK